MRKRGVSLQRPISLLTNCHHSVTLSIRTASRLLLRRHLPDVHVDVVDLRLSAGCVYTLSITRNVVNLSMTRTASRLAIMFTDDR